MINKTHILGLILVPSLIFGSNIKQEILTLQAQLTDLGNKMEAQMNLINYIVNEGGNVFAQILTYFPTEEEKQSFEVAVREFEAFINKALHDGIYDADKIEKSFFASYPDHRQDFGRIKFTMIRAAIECFVFENMTKEYYCRVHQLIKLQHTLNNSK
jgi:glutamate-1-semialdehyde aminotransferase